MKRFTNTDQSRKMGRIKWFTWIPILLLVAACQPAEEEVMDTYPNADLLVEAEWLLENLGSENLVVVDMREERIDDFIPGAVDIGGGEALVDGDHDIESFLLGPDQFAALMSEAGINNRTDVVIYDDGNGLWAARLFFALELYGHDNVRILNGGLAAWERAGGALAEAAAEPVPAVYTIEAQREIACDLNDILAAIEDENTMIVDTRSYEEYSGEDVRTERGGHIPGAVHLEWVNFVQDEEVPYFRPVEEIRSLLADHGIDREKRILTHCQSNVRGSHVYFILRLMGYDDIQAYEGSWYEYGNLEDVPIEM